MSETTTEQLAEIEEQAEPTAATEYTPPEGWRVLAVGEVLQEGDEWIRPWDGRWISVCVGSDAAVSEGQYIRQIASEPDCQTEEIQYLRREISTLQNQLGESQRRVTQLEELVSSLRTINEAQEKSFRLAGQANTDLQHRLDVVSAEWAEQSETVRKLRIELDAAQQVPADSPELRQLRADLAEVTRERDQHLDSYQRIFGDLETIRETTKAAAVEAIAEWLQPIRAVDNEHLANETLQHLPQIMRHLTGLTQD